MIRNMADPTVFNDPDKMTSRFWRFDSGDNGGVHTNSGVNNKAILPARRRADVQHLHGQADRAREGDPRLLRGADRTSSPRAADYGALGNALRQACTNLTGTNGIVAADCTQVNNAVLATEMDIEAAAPDTQIDSGPGNDRRPDSDLDVQHPAQFGRAPQPNKPAATFQCSVDTGTPSWGPCSGPGGSHTPASDLADGTYTFRVRGSIGSNTDPTPATRDFTVSTADMELVSKADSAGSGVRRREPDLHDPGPQQRCRHRRERRGRRRPAGRHDLPVELDPVHGGAGRDADLRPRQPRRRREQDVHDHGLDRPRPRPQQRRRR